LKNEGKEADIDWRTSPAYDCIASRALQKMLLKIDNDSDDNGDSADEEDVDAFVCSDIVANALITTEYDE
jgi:hypothetical protein